MQTSKIVHEEKEDAANLILNRRIIGDKVDRGTQVLDLLKFYYNVTEFGLNKLVVTGFGLNKSLTGFGFCKYCTLDHGEL